MHDILQHFARRLNRVLTRLHRARPASVLILVIALLVLMALIGTAFISTARVDRYSATQHTYNTQVDLAAQGMLNLAEGAMLRNIQGRTGVFRQASSSTSTTPGTYQPPESLITDLYLADRVPPPMFYTLPVSNYPGVTSIPPAAIGAAANQDYFPTWLYITAPLNPTAAVPTGQFEAPYAVDWLGRPVQSPVNYVQASGLVREQVLPWAIPVPQPDGSTKMFPAFVAIPTNPNLMLADGVTRAMLPIIVLAADTDGDGIADAGFIRLGGGQIEGATYYGAVRIIDNAAAFNASVGFAINPYPAPGNVVPGDLFPTDIDLQDMTSDSLAALNAYRFNNGTGKNGANFNPNPIDDTGTTHTDFAFGTPYEALWTQLGCRLGNPGYNASTSNKYQALPISEGMNLASRFCLANPTVASASPSLLETYLHNSMLGPTSNRAPYAPGNLGQWFADQFNYDQGGAPNMPLRAIMVARNPVSGFTPSWFNDQGIYGNPTLNGAGNYVFGDRVQAPDPNNGGSMRGFVCIQPHAAGSQAPMNGTSYNNAFWSAMPWASHPTRINANTGTFGQLWTAYWSVMQDSPDATGTYPGGTTAQVDIDPNNNPATNNLAHQFRNPIRTRMAGVLPLTRSQVIQLRSALAAVNTIDLRDGDTDITSRTIKLVDTAGANPVYANVYGAERQPYFSALLINYDPNLNPTTPYVVVELYNPHSVPIRLTGWKLASLNRGGGTVSLQEVGDLNTTLKGFTTKRGVNGQVTVTGPGDVILPGEKIVLESNPAFRPANINTDWNNNSVIHYTNQSTTGANLDSAVGKELVLLRPRVTGVVGINTAAENTYNENNLIDLVPLDNLDLVGVGPSTAAPPQPARFRYARANQITSDCLSAAWHCVYPGPYNLGSPIAQGTSSPAFPFHHLGLLPVLAADIPSANGGPPAVRADNGNFGRTNQLFSSAPTPTSGNALSANATYGTRALKINGLDQAGPNRAYAEAMTGNVPNGSVTAVSGTLSFPLGGFPRRGDLLEIPFIGSYVISSTPDPSAQGAVVKEMNSVTMDSVLAQFKDPATNVPLSSSYDADTTYTQFPVTYIPQGVFHNEQIGHFCPMDVGSTDFKDDPALGNQAGFTYHWAKSLFDYVDVFTPQDAYLANIDPAVTSANVSGDPSVTGSAVKYPGAGTTPLPVPVSGSPNLPVKPLTGQALVQQLQGLADTAGSEGQININTASAKVLSGIPFFTPDIDAYYAADNFFMGYSIATWREGSSGNSSMPHAGYGPFRSIFDIMKIQQGGAQPDLYKVYNIILTTKAGDPSQGSFNTSVYPGETTSQYSSLSPFVPTMPKLGAEMPVYTTPPPALFSTPSPPYPTEADQTDHVFGDVKSRFLGLIRISNLITTRSDSFTIYAQVQAWQNLGTSQPTLVATKRAATLLDRTQVKPLRSTTGKVVGLTAPGATNVPND